jgi:predicted metal-binding membrane protein
MTLRSRTVLITWLLGGALGAWIALIQRMHGMDAGPGTDLGGLGWFVGIWVTMTAAMMLPSATPAVVMFGRIRRNAPPWLFVSGYVVAWTAYGLVAYAVYWLVRTADPAFLRWGNQGPLVAGAALVAAGLFQLTPLKQACLRHCRSPMSFLMRGRDDPLGALWMGMGHGAYCVGCCTGLMLALFALGVMSLFWMALVAAAIFVEKALPGGARFARVVAVVLIVLGIVVIAWPSSAPGVTQPSDGSTPMEMMR